MYIILIDKNRQSPYLLKKNYLEFNISIRNILLILISKNCFNIEIQNKILTDFKKQFANTKMINKLANQI